MAKNKPGDGRSAASKADKKSSKEAKTKPKPGCAENAKAKPKAAAKRPSLSDLANIEPASPARPAGMPPIRVQ